nr:hypothetical protein CFP56_39548 [Quercus suber]
MALRACKPEGGRRTLTWLDAKELRWPKDLSSGPEITNISGGPVKAHAVAKAPSPSEGTLVKPNPLFGYSDGQSSWVRGESSIGGSRDDSGSPVTASVPESEGVNPDDVARASVVSKPGFSGLVVTYRRKRDETQTPTAGDLRVGTTARPPGAAAEAPMAVTEAPMRAILHSCPVAELLAPISVASRPDWVVERQFGDVPRNKLDSNSPGKLEGMDIGSHLAVPSPEKWKVSKQFSPLNILGREGVEEVFTEVPSISDTEGLLLARF